MTSSVYLIDQLAKKKSLNPYRQLSDLISFLLVNALVISNFPLVFFIFTFYSFNYFAGMLCLYEFNIYVCCINACHHRYC